MLARFSMLDTIYDSAEIQVILSSYMLLYPSLTDMERSTWLPRAYTVNIGRLPSVTNTSRCEPFLKLHRFSFSSLALSTPASKVPSALSPAFEG